MFLGGLPVYIDNQLGVEYHRKQVRFPRSKKVRIRNKWAKQSWNWQRWTTQKAVAYQVGNSFVMNSKAYEAVKAKVASC
jgi:hypothetical protein